MLAATVQSMIVMTLLVLFGYGAWLVQLTKGQFICRTPLLLADIVLADNV